MNEHSQLLAERYQVDSLIGRGGMADVYIGHDIKLDRKVAIKVLRSHLSDDSAFRARFQQEALASSKMTHPSIVRVFDAGEDVVIEGETVQPFIVMEWVDGIVLKDLLEDGSLPENLALDYADQLLQALQYSHRAGIIHRDIKPGNIMITHEGRAKLMDFGIARAVSDSSATVEQTSTVLGTAQYFSPEQARGEVVDARTDLYSLGLVLFEMLTGKTPFEGDSALAIAYQHVNEEPPEPQSFNNEISDAINALVLRSIVKNRDQRFQTANEFRQWISRAIGGEMVPLPLNKAEIADLGAIGTIAQEVEESQDLFRDISSGHSVPKGTQKRPPVLWIWSGVIGVIVLLGALIFWVANLVPTNLTASTTTKVPDVIGATWESAQQLIEAEELRPVEYRVVDDNVPEGQVVSTDPLAGQVVNKDFTVKVYVSSGPQLTAVPALANLTLDAAKKKIEDLGFTVGSIEHVDSANVAKDVVISSDPAKGEKLFPGSTVNLTVSNGKVKLPNLKNMPLSEANKTLNDLQLLVSAVPDPDCTISDGNPIINQSPGPGSVEQRSEVKIYYCSGVRSATSEDAPEDD